MRAQLKSTIRTAHELLVSPKFRRIRARFRNEAFTLLDVGCGNHSPTRTRRIFENCIYYGLDRDVYNNDASDFAVMEEFYRIDLAEDDLSTIPEGYFDVILVNHVIEHITNGLDVIARLCRKLKGGGVIYIEFPSVRSLFLPSMNGTLHFCDDGTHVRLYDVKEVANVLLESGCRVMRAGRRRDAINIVLTPLRFLYLKYVKRTGHGSAFWDLLGFAEYVYGERKKQNFGS